MSFVNDSINHYKTIRQTCYIANIAYLILRVFYLALFIITKFYILMWVDIASILIYVFCFFLMKKKKYYIYALLCGNEFFAFVITTTLMLGFNAGFHFYLIGLCVVSFFTSYFSKNHNIKGSIVWTGLSIIIYLVLYFVTSFNQPYYLIDKWLEMTLFTLHAVVVFLFVAFYMVTFLKYTISLEKKIMSESRTDELTQINNRYALYDFFNQTSDKSSKALALFDIDDFKLINDKYGHVAGDYILKEVAKLTMSVLSGSFVCRYGGEEFVVVLNAEDAFDKLETLRKAIEKEVFEFEGNQHRITITTGASNYQKDMTLEEWVNLADNKMYFGKNSGKNKTII